MCICAYPPPHNPYKSTVYFYHEDAFPILVDFFTHGAAESVKYVMRTDVHDMHDVAQELQSVLPEFNMNNTLDWTILRGLLFYS